MPSVQLDLRGLAPGQAPAPAELGAVATAEALVVRGPVAGLAGVLSALLRAQRTAAVPVAWEPSEDLTAEQLARDLGLGTGPSRALSLVRDDHGGVLLHRGRIEPAPEAGPDTVPGAGPGARRLGLAAHHDDRRVADGWIRHLEARPDWASVDRLSVAVRRSAWGPARRSTGRALQVACEPARVVRDGVAYLRPVRRWTWYADDRVRWLLQP